MIDEIFGELFDAVLEVVPDAVWAVLFVGLGVVTTLIGVLLVADSVRLGGALAAVGVLLSAGVLYVWYR
jgi:hypothetical protein